MLPVRSVRAHFAWPSSALDGFGPLRALEDLRVVDLVDCRINRARCGQLAHTASDGEARCLALHAGDAPDPGHLQQIWHVFGVVDFVEQSPEGERPIKGKNGGPTHESQETAILAIRRPPRSPEPRRRRYETSFPFSSSGRRDIVRHPNKAGTHD